MKTELLSAQVEKTVAAVTKHIVDSPHYELVALDSELHDKLRNEIMSVLEPHFT